MDLKNENTSEPIAGTKKSWRKGSRGLALTGLFAALIMLLTLVHIPMFGGAGGSYIHLGDAVIFAACIIIGWRAIPAAAVGSALADLILGAVVYAVPTFIIKGIMAGIVVLLTLKNKKAWLQVVAFAAASIFMQGAYLLFEVLFATTLYGTAYAFVAASFLFGWIQSAIGIPLGLWLSSVLKKIRIEYVADKREP